MQGHLRQMDTPFRRNLEIDVRFYGRFAIVGIPGQQKDHLRMARITRMKQADAPNTALHLSLCLIVRDNEGTIEACLESVQPWVDEMIVVDTGSTDKTPEIVQRFGARLFHLPWCDDFSAARNESLKAARGEWIFWIDSDETIDARNGRKLRELAYGSHDPSVFGYVMQQVHPRLGPGRTASLSSGLARIGQDAAGAGAAGGCRQVGRTVEGPFDTTGRGPADRRMAGQSGQV